MGLFDGNLFGGMFDLNGDGKTDLFESILAFEEATEEEDEDLFNAGGRDLFDDSDEDLFEDEDGDLFGDDDLMGDIF